MHSNYIYSTRKTLLSFIVISQKFELKLISAKFLLPIIYRNELSIALGLHLLHGIHRTHILRASPLSYLTNLGTIILIDACVCT